MLCAIAGCTSQRPVWPTVPGENSPDQVTIVTNGPQGMAAFRVKNKPQLANTNEAPENLRANLESSPFQDYDRDMIKAIMKRWRELKSGVPTIGINHATGKVVVEFRLHADGRISDLKTVSSKVNGRSRALSGFLLITSRSDRRAFSLIPSFSTCGGEDARRAFSRASASCQRRFRRLSKSAIPASRTGCAVKRTVFKFGIWATLPS